MKITGPDYIPSLDKIRLETQLGRILDLMLDGNWRTCGEIALLTHDPLTSIGSQLRNLRLEENGSYFVERRRVGDEKLGLYEYRVNIPVMDEAWFDREITRREAIFEEAYARCKKAKEILDKIKKNHMEYLGARF